jgi:Ca2+/Na+ antiporter
MFIEFLMGVIPIFLIMIGIGALIYFISEIKSRLEIGKEGTGTSGETKTEGK